MTGRVAPTLMEITGRRPLKPALGDQRRTLTWRELEARTNALGHGIEHDLGVTPGSNVAVIATNRYEFIEALIGAMRAGMVVVPVKASWTAEEIGYLLEDADARLVIPISTPVVRPQHFGLRRSST